MISKFATLPALAALVALLAATHPTQSFGAEDKAYDIAVPGRYVIDPKNTRADILQAILAVQQAARREGDLGKGTGMVTLAEGIKPVFTDTDPHFRLDGFSLAETAINSFAPSAKGKDGQRLIGTMRLTHPSGLGATVGFIVDYLRKGDGIVVNELSALTVTPPTPRIVALAVPATDLSRLEQRAGGRFVSLFEAVGMVGRPLPLAPVDAKTPLSVVVLSADRMLPGDRLELKSNGPGAKPIAGLPASRPLQMGGYVGVVQDFPSGLAPGRIEVVHVTDLHPKVTDGRRAIAHADLVGTASSTSSPTSASQPAGPQPAAPPFTPPGGWKRIDMAALGVRLPGYAGRIAASYEAPAAWNRAGEADPNQVYLDGAAEPDGNVPYLTVRVERRPPGMAAQSKTKAFVSQIAEGGFKFKLLEQGPTTIAGRPAHVVSLQYAESPSVPPEHDDFAVIEAGDLFYTIAFSASASSYRTTRAIFDRAKLSFTLAE